MALADSLNTPKASAFLSGKGMPPTPKGYVGAQEIGPIKEELAQARTKAEKDVGMADINIEREKSSQTIRDLEGQQVLAQKTAEDIRALPEREKLKTKREEFTEMKFVPTKDTAQDIAGLFSLVNVIGMAMGGGGKQSAQQAMYAMNGMLEGYQKGRGDLYKKEKESFDKNFKAMQEAVKTLEKDYEEAIKMYQYDKEAADIARKLALAKSGSSLFKAMEDRVGFMATLNAIKDTVSSVDKAADMQNKLQKAEDDRKLKEEQMLLRLQQKQQATQKQTQEQARMQRAVNALGGVASALESIVALPEGATTGWLPNLQTKDGMVNAIRNQLGRKISSVDAELMNTYLSGIGRNLAAIESSGLATGLATLSQQLQSGVYINAGVDDPYKVAGKLADIKRIAIENILPSIEAGTLTPGQVKSAETLINRINTVIPYNTIDVAQAYKAAKAPSKQTLGQAAAAPMAGNSAFTADDEKRLRELEEKYRGPK